MKIIHLTYTLRYGGIETMLINIANEQAKTESVFVIILNDAYDESIINKLDNKIQFINIGRKLGSHSIFPIIKLNWLLYKLKPDVIHLHHPGAKVFLLFKLFVHKIVLTMHDIPRNDDLKRLKTYPVVYSISKSVSQAISEKLYPVVKNTPVVYNGIMVDNFSNTTKRNKGVFRIVQIGRLTHYKKGQDLVIRACELLVNNGVHNFYVEFIGDGESREYLKQMVTQAGVEQHVKFLGSKDQSWIQHNLCTYDLFVQASRIEGFGLTVAEAMAAKVPVLVSDQEGPLEIIDYGKYGMTFKAGDANDLASKIRKAMNSQISVECLDAAYNHVKENFDVRVTSKLYLDYYRKDIIKE